MKEHIEALERWLPELTLNGPTHAAVCAALELMKAAQPLDEAAEREHCRASFERDMRPLSGVQPMHVEWLMRERAQARAERHIEICVLRVDVADWKRRAETAQVELSAQARLSDIQILEHAAAAQAGRAREAETKLSAAQVKIAEQVEMLDRDCTLKAPLSAAQADVERLQTSLARNTDPGFHRDSLQSQLSAAQAEIERFTEAHATQTLELHASQNEYRIVLDRYESAARFINRLETKLADLRAELEHAAAELETSGICMRDARLAARIRSVLEASR